MVPPFSVIKHSVLENRPFSSMMTPIYFGDFPASHVWWHQRVNPNIIPLLQLHPHRIHIVVGWTPIFIPLLSQYYATIIPILVSEISLEPHFCRLNLHYLHVYQRVMVNISGQCLPGCHLLQLSYPYALGQGWLLKISIIILCLAMLE